MDDKISLKLDPFADAGTPGDAATRVASPGAGASGGGGIDWRLVRSITPKEHAPFSAKEATAVRAAEYILAAFDANPTREGLRETPKRMVRMLREICTPEPFNLTVFESEGYDEMVVQAGIPFYSLCEHHVLPFFGEATVGYIPDGKIVGLSKLARVVQHFARGLQNQERITQNAANLLAEELRPKGVAVMVKARHLCMEMRGVKSPGAATTTTCLTGMFKEDPRTRAEFMALVRGSE